MPKKPRPETHQASSPDAGSTNSGAWWDAPKDQAGPALWRTTDVIDKSQATRRFEESTWVALYENRPPLPNGQTHPTSPGQLYAYIWGGVRATLNVTKSAIDTVAALVSKNNAEIRFITSNGKPKTQKRARKLTRLMSGWFKAAGVHEQSQRIFKDAGKCYLGALEIWGDHAAGEVKCKRVRPDKIRWNELEGDDPGNLYFHDEVPKSQLLAEYPEAADIIKAAPPSRIRSSMFRRRAALGLADYADMVEIRKAWHLPAGDQPGRYVLTLQSGSLVDEPWEHDFFPFAFFTWDDAHEGFGGKPAAEQLSGYHISLNRRFRQIEKHGDKVVEGPTTWLERSSEQLKDHHATLSGKVSYYSGQPPVTTNYPDLSAGFWQHFYWTYEKALAELGVSMMQAQGEKPNGVESGTALMAFNDITTTRFVIQGQRFERYYVQVAKIAVALFRKLYEKNPSLRIKAPGTKDLEEIAWKDVDLKEDQYEIQSSAVSSLPTHAVGRLEFVEKLLKVGLIPAEYGLKALDMPDFERLVTVETAHITLAEKQIETAMDGRFLPPSKYQGPAGLALLSVRAQKELLLAIENEHPDKILDLLSRLIQEADRLLEEIAEEQRQRQGPAAAAGAPAPGPAGGAPAALAGMPMGGAPPALAGLPGAPGLPVPAVPSAAPALPVAAPALV